MDAGYLLDGRYEIAERIGEGGFSDVYAALDRQSQNQVALKVLHQVDGGKRQEMLRKRFTLEAELVAQVKHPDIVDIYGFGVSDQDRLYIALELLEGITLEDLLVRSGRMKVKRAVRLMIRVLEALQAAHSLGIIHRDLKPSNLFLDKSDAGTERLRILDFGIAFVTDEPGNRMTRTGQINGTPQYLAPEYIQQQIVTSALDVYQMGLIFVEMCTGTIVVDDDNPYKCLMTHVSGDFELPDGLMNSELGPIIRRALNPDHEARYQNAGEFRDALMPLAAIAGQIDITGEQIVVRRPKKSKHSLPVQLEVLEPAPPAEAAPIAEPEPAERNSNLVPVVLISAVVAVAGGGMAFVMMQPGSDKVSAKPPPVVKPVAAAAADAGGGDKIEDPAPDALVAMADTSAGTEPTSDIPEPTAPKEMPKAETIEVTVSVTPDNADLLRGEDTIGQGKASVVFDTEDDDAVEIKIQSTGYITQVVRVGPTDERALEVTLKPEEATEDVGKRRPRGKRPRGKKKQKLGFFE